MDTYEYEPESVEMMHDEDETSSSSSNISNDSLKSIDSNENQNYNNNHNSNTNDANKEAINGNHFQFTVSNEHISLGYNPNSLSKSVNKEEENEEDGERKRFQIELEFVQSLANPNYLNFLAQHGYFKNPTFLNYLKYLTYWKEPEYNKYLVYPQCLALLELLLHEQFLKEIVNAQCSKFVDEQLLLVWLHYKRRRESMRIDPIRIPPNIDTLNFEEKTGTKLEHDSNVNIDQRVESGIDPFSVEALMAIEKF
jgi:mediator of RNA polymerase II transcription subunit 31